MFMRIIAAHAILVAMSHHAPNTRAEEDMSTNTTVLGIVIFEGPGGKRA